MKCDRCWRSLFLVACCTGAALLIAGCDDAAQTDSRRGPIQSGGGADGLFESVAENLNKFETYQDTGQILKQTTDRLNQWYMQETPQVAWQPDPLLEQLDPKLRQQPTLQAIDEVRFQFPDDGWYLQEAVWLRDISGYSRADKFEDVEVARSLFDWTVRNIKLESPLDAEVRHKPFETLLLGRGTALERGWVFILLTRQQGLDVVYLGIRNPDSGAVRPWLTALVAGEDLYLFDPELGLPIPGPEPGSVATLAQVAADPELLRGLDLDDQEYPVTAKDLKHVVAEVEGSPAALSKRMALVESRLSGEQRLKLTSPGNELAEKVAGLPHVADVQLWPLPLEVYRAQSARDKQAQTEAQKETVVYQTMPSLKTGRALHFKGEFDGVEGAKTHYLNARPPDEYIENYRLPPELAEKFPRNTLGKVEAANSLLMREAKQAASFWLGLIFFEQGDYPNAVEFLANRTLDSKHNTPWAEPARYNLARAYEASGELDKAIELYESDTTSPQSHGNRLRARWLKEGQEPAEEDKPAEEPQQEAESADKADKADETEPAAESAESAGQQNPVADAEGETETP